jgi:hypothetical protein
MKTPSPLTRTVSVNGVRETLATRGGGDGRPELRGSQNLEGREGTNGSGKCCGARTRFSAWLRVSFFRMTDLTVLAA